MTYNTVCGRWMADDAERQAILTRARECARLTLPYVLPLLDQSRDAKLQDNYQSIGSRGVIGLAGQMVLALYPPDRPWFKQEPVPKVMFDDAVPVEVKQALAQRLFLEDLTILAALETSGRPAAGSGHPSRFRSAKRAAMEQLLVTGDVLERVGDDLSITVFRRDKYVTRRDGTGQVMYHIVLEELDPLSLTPQQTERAGLRAADLESMRASERLADLYTMCEWQPRSRKWHTTQTLQMKAASDRKEEAIVNESDDAVCPFVSTPYKLVHGEHYGRGLVEALVGDLGALDTLSLRALEFAEMVSKFHLFLSDASDLDEADLSKPSGTIHRGRVENGVALDLAAWKVDKVADFSVLEEVRQGLRKDLSAGFLIQPEMVRDSERTTAFEVQSVTMRELNGALGGVYSPIADMQQIPLFERARYQLVKDGVLRPHPKGATRVSLLTGVAALANQARFNNIVSFAQLVQAIAPNAAARINDGVLLDAAARYLGVHEPGLVYTDDQMRERVNQALATQAQSQAIEQGVKTAGAVTEALLTANAA